MNFYCDSQGVVFHVDAERIFQGSLGANKIRLIGQFPSTAQVLVTYELPDGTKTSPKIMTPVDTLEQVQAPNGGLYSIWESLIGATPKIDDNGNVVTDDNGDVIYDLIPAITALYGTVRVQFFVYGASSGKLNGQVLAVASSSFTVEKGVPAEIPEFNLDDGTTLLQNILAIVANYETIVENAVFDGFVKKTGDTMTGPLIVENSRSLGRSGVLYDGFHVQSGEEAETHYGQGFILRKADTNAYPNGTFEEIVNALPQESGTIATEEYVDDKTDTISQDIAVVNAILEQSGIVSKYKATIEDTYSERVTADGANVLDGSKAKLEKVVGNTVRYDADENGLNGKLANASFGGIESTNADGTKTVTLDFSKTETPLGTTIDFENKKITDYGVTIVLTGEEVFSNYHSTTNGVVTNGVYVSALPNVENNNQNGVTTDGVITTAQKVNRILIGAGNKILYWVGILDILGFTTAGTQATGEEARTAVENFKAWLAQRYADGNPVTIRYVSSTLQSETDFSAEQSASGNEYTAYKGGTEKVLDNDGAEYGAENTLLQNYIIVTEVK